MTDISKSNNYIAYFINVEAIDIVGVATDTFFQEKSNSSSQVQLSDIDIEFNMSHADYANGIVPLDIGGVALTTELKEVFVNSGCPDSLFRKMTVEGQQDLLHQLVAPGCFELINNELPAAPDLNVYRGVFDDIDIMIKYLNNSLIGCIKGREDYQEIFLLDTFFKKICQKTDLLKWTIPIPVYDDVLLSVMNKAWNTSAIEDNRFKDDNYLNVLRKDELLMLLECAVHNKNRVIGEKVYKCIKKLSLPMTDKKQALLLLKKIPE